MARKEVTTAQPDPEVLREMDAGNTLPAPRGSFTLGQVDGDNSHDSQQLPRLQIAYGVGKLATNFRPGDLVLAKENLLVHKGEPLNVIILMVSKYYKEYLTPDAYKAQMQPRVYTTRAEVLAAGGTTEWGAKDPVTGRSPGPTFNGAMDLKMMIQKPKDVVCGLFGTPIGGEEYSPAIWSVDKTAYKRIDPVVSNSARFALRTRGIYSAIFQICMAIEQVNGNATPVPQIKLLSHLTDEAVAEIKALFQDSAPAAEPAELPA
ncbi:MAG: hypothetical protein E4H01_15095 [Lysobacterales bacterium]|nr:MAG: hypothetical protein E4H01_15095 [Xanthomonadales bacterium]